jgi:hypothetical protein
MITPHKKAELIRLVKKVLNGQATPEEKQFLEKYYDYFDKDEFEPVSLSPDQKKQLEDRILQNINLGSGGKNKGRMTSLFKNRFLKIAAVAAMLIAVAYACYQYPSSGHHNDHSVKQNVSYHQGAILPGGNKAILTLSNGSSIVLDSAHNGGILATQGNTRVSKANSGRLVYSRQPDGNHPKGTSAEPKTAIGYNTLRTPRGGQYQLRLPDGTDVWLNSASSITFPTAFTAKARKVVLTGEGYFEVAENKDQPFIVQVGAVEIEDLGTHFNVMAYNNESVMKTTLLEGSVRVTSGNKRALLKPGQQAVTHPNTPGNIRISKVNTADAIAWKNGFFSFHSTDIHEIMRQIARWYDVDVSYGDSLDVFLNGSISRSAKVSEVFKMLELTGELRFDIRGKKIIVKQHP